MTKKIKNKNVVEKGDKSGYLMNKARNKYRIEVKNPLFSGFITKEGVSLCLTPGAATVENLSENLYLLYEFVQNNVQEDKQGDMFSAVETAFCCKALFKEYNKDKEQRSNTITNIKSIEDFISVRSRND